MTWERVTSGNCEAGGWAHFARARWQGPMTPSGGDLWCGTCKQSRERLDQGKKAAKGSAPCLQDAPHVAHSHGVLGRLWCPGRVDSVQHGKGAQP